MPMVFSVASFQSEDRKPGVSSYNVPREDRRRRSYYKISLRTTFLDIKKLSSQKAYALTHIYLYVRERCLASIVLVIYLYRKVMQYAFFFLLKDAVADCGVFCNLPNPRLGMILCPSALCIT